MKISTKGRYALRMMVYLASKKDGTYVSLKEIADDQSISKKYLEQIVPMLTRDGLLRANRGNRGGYLLAKKPEECTVGDVLRATEGSLAPVSCLEYDEVNCDRADTCSTLFVWKGLYKAVNDYLDSITIADIAAQSTELGGDDYCI